MFMKVVAGIVKVPTPVGLTPLAMVTVSLEILCTLIQFFLLKMPTCS